jgi:phospholipid transport system transporter-binding protein
MANTEAVAVDRAGALLRLRGRLDRASVPALWPQALRALDGAQGLDLHGIDALDSAGLALLAELAGRIAARGPVRIEGAPAGLAGLCAAYRMTPDLIRSEGTA